jgi:predicted nucleotidyltransferase
MQEKSSNSVKVFFADKDKILLQVREYSKKLKKNHPEVEKVGLFGSYVTDEYGPASDVDLLIILKSSSKRFIDRIPDFLPSEIEVSCDCFPYTIDEINRMKSEGNPWILHVLEEAVWF